MEQFLDDVDNALLALLFGGLLVLVLWGLFRWGAALQDSKAARDDLREENPVQVVLLVVVLVIGVVWLGMLFMLSTGSSIEPGPLLWILPVVAFVLTCFLKMKR